MRVRKRQVSLKVFVERTAYYERHEEHDEEVEVEDRLEDGGGPRVVANHRLFF